MGWAYYEINGKPCGYSVQAKCEEPECDKDIDRGLAFCCGEKPGGSEYGCGGYFCYEHLLLGKAEQYCKRCYEKAPDLCDQCESISTHYDEDNIPLCDAHKAKSL